MTNKRDSKSKKRLKILETGEIETIYGLPIFTDDERRKYFTLSPVEKTAMMQLHFIKSRIYYILQLGYFKAHHQFLVFTLEDVAEDAQYIKNTYFPDTDLTNLEITKVTRLNQQKIILKLFQYRYCQELDPIPFK